MIDMEQRLNYLDSVLAELSHAQMRTEIEMKRTFKGFAERDAAYNRRMAERDAKFDCEMAERVAERKLKAAEHELQLEKWRAEVKQDNRQMKKAWGDMANRLGTVAEDVVAPNIPRLALEEFGFGEVEDLLVRPQRVSRRGERRFREYDVICAGPDIVIVTDVKSTPSAHYIEEARNRLADFFDFYPEYEGRQLIGMFASWAINDKLLPLISDAGLYGLAMGDETMDIVARPKG